MKILLVVPYQDVEPYILPNLGLGYLASALQNRGHAVSYLDCLKEKIGPNEWRMFLQEGQYNLVGIQMYSYTYNVVKAMLKAAKETLTRVITVVGGPHANAIPEETLADNPEIDFVIHGEGETALPDLVDRLQFNNASGLASVANLAWRNNGHIELNPKCYLENLDEISAPAWNLMNPRSYPILSHGLLNRAHPIAPIFATRGCPYACTFCSSRLNMGQKIRKRSPAKIVDEIEMLVKEYGVKEIHFEDDNFTFYKDFTASVCQEIIDRNLEIFWACPNGVRLDSLDAELLGLMERSGCYSFAVGIESGSERVLQLMKKGISARRIRQKIRLIAQNTHIKMTGFVIFGFPGETEEDLKETEDLVLQEPLHRLAVGPFIPLPGTQIYDTLVAQKKIPKKYDWNLLSPYEEKNIFVFGSMSKKKLLKKIHNIHLKFYLRPRIIFGILHEIHSFAQFKIALKMLFYWLGIAKIKRN